MKIFFVFATVFFLVFAKNGNSFAQVTMNPSDSLRRLNLTYFLDKPVDSLVHNFPLGIRSSGFWGHVNSKKVKCLDFDFDDGSKVIIYVKIFRFMNPESDTGNWDYSLYKKEAIFSILVLYSNGEHNSAVLE